MISVLLSVFNESEDYIMKSIESILNQTYRDIELIIILDNPARDDLRKIILYFCDRDSRIKPLFNEKNIGLVASLNRALKEAKGEYIARMDADDISLPNRLQEEWKLLQKGDYDLVGTSFLEMDEHGNVKMNNKNNPFPIDDLMIKKHLRYANCIAHPTWLAKKSLYDSLNGYRDIPCAEDYDFILRAALLDKKMGLLPMNGILYRCNLNGISQRNTFKQLLVAYYLAKQYRKNKEASERNIKKILKKIYTPKNEMRFKKGESYIQIAYNARENNKKLEVVYWMLRCFLISPFHVMLMVQNYKIKNIGVTNNIRYQKVGRE